jgi:hypothetical protein
MHRLLLDRIGDDDAAGRALLVLDPAHHHAIMQWLDLHDLSSSSTTKTAVERPRRKDFGCSYALLVDVVVALIADECYNLNIGSPDRLSTPLDEIFHLPDRVAGELTDRTPDGTARIPHRFSCCMRSAAGHKKSLLILPRGLSCRRS